MNTPSNITDHIPIRDYQLASSLVIHDGKRATFSLITATSMHAWMHPEDPDAICVGTFDYGVDTPGPIWYCALCLKKLEPEPFNLLPVFDHLALKVAYLAVPEQDHVKVPQEYQLEEIVAHQIRTHKHNLKDWMLVVERQGDRYYLLDIRNPKKEILEQLEIFAKEPWEAYLAFEDTPTTYVKL